MGVLPAMVASRSTAWEQGALTYAQAACVAPLAPAEPARPPDRSRDLANLLSLESAFDRSLRAAPGNHPARLLLWGSRALASKRAEAAVFDVDGQAALPW